MRFKGRVEDLIARMAAHPKGERLIHYAILVRLDRPIGIYLLLWPCWWALWIASEGFPNLWILLVFTLGTIFMRSAGCAINDYADRNIDGQVERTRARPLATGAVSPKEALGVFAVLCAVSFLLVLTTNRLTVYFSFVGVVLAVIYPFAKRYTYLPQVVLGAAFGWAIPMAYTAVTGGTDKNTWLLYIIAILWAVAYDTLYSMADREDDLKLGVKSTAILFGEADVAIVAFIQAVVLGGLLLIGSALEMSTWFYLGWVVAVLLAIYQIFMVADRHPAHCIRGFLNNHYLGMAVFVGIALHYALAT
ncbi:MAG: 4-hydroxybenzoate octaprenyltransferase [Pseudomonadota bacterium]